MADIGDPAETTADIAARQASGHLTRISFKVNRAMCARLKSFVDEYVARGAYSHYDGASRARRFEGAGCAIFGAGVVDVGGLLRRSLMTPAWARTEMIGSARIGDFLGAGSYRYGGNLVAVDDSGAHWVWPKGVAVPASATPGADLLERARCLARSRGPGVRGRRASPARCRPSCRSRSTTPR